MGEKAIALKLWKPESKQMGDNWLRKPKKAESQSISGENREVTQFGLPDTSGNEDEDGMVNKTG